MKKILLPLLLFGFRVALSQTGGIISGKISDKQTDETLNDVNVFVKGTNVSTSTNEKGTFVLSNLSTTKIVLVISRVGYETIELPVTVSENKPTVVNLALNIENQVGNEVVVSATQRPEKITNAPASIHVISTKDLQQFAGSNVGELVAKVQGIEYTRSGVDEITFNARGLNSAFNNKVFQLVDGRNTMASASAGIALFNNGSTNKDDIERIEIVLGPQSALYGPNAHNGLFNYITKDPRKYQGTSLSTSVGSQSQFSTRFRHALKINDRWAYKITGEHATGKDYEWYDSIYAGSATGTPFGNAVAIPQKITDFSFHRYRGEAHVYYNLTPKTSIIVSGGGSKFTRLQLTTAGHNSLRDVTYGFLQARFVQRHFFANFYNTWGNLGRTLLLGGYTRDFWNRTHSTLTAGPNRYLPPDTAETITSGANTVKEKSHRLNAEVQYNYQFKKTGLSIVTGLNYQLDRLNGYGVTLIDSFQRISIAQYGAVLQLDKSLPCNLRLVATTRFDHHRNFGGFLAPRFALLKSVNSGTFRVTWGKAIAMPSIQAQYAGINRTFFGNAKGIYYIPNGTNYYKTETYAMTTPLVPEQVTTWELGYKGYVSRHLYVDINYYNGINKNFISSPRTVFGRVLKVNGIPVRHNPATAGQVLRDSTLTNAFFTTSFNYGEVKAYGIDAGVTYSFNKYVSFAVNYSWFGSDITDNNIKNDANNDGIVSLEERSLNAPKNRAVGVVSFQNLYKSRLFVTVSARYVEQYDFYSGNQIGTKAGQGQRGRVPGPGNSIIFKNFDWGPLGGFTTFDINTGWRFNEMVSINGGVSNLLNTRQIEMVGSPSIGRLFMFELKVEVPYPKK